MVLGDRENDVAVAVVFDLRERALVARKQNRPHVCGVCRSGEGRVRVVGGGLCSCGDCQTALRTDVQFHYALTVCAPHSPTTSCNTAPSSPTWPMSSSLNMRFWNEIHRTDSESQMHLLTSNAALHINALRYTSSLSSTVLLLFQTSRNIVTDL